MVEAKITTASLNSDADYECFKDIFYPITDYIFVEKVEQVWEPYKMPKYDNESVTVGDYLLSNETLPVCPIPFTMMRIFSDGGVHVCCGDWEHKTQYGDVLTQNLPDLWMGSSLTKIRDEHLQKPREDIRCLISPDCRRLWKGVDIDRNTGIFINTNHTKQ